MAPRTRSARLSAAYAAKQAILAGDFDADLQALLAAIGQRKSELRSVPGTTEGEQP
jgi:hypothetical protein